MKKIIIHAADVCKSFANNGGQNHVLNMVTLDIYENDFTIIMGPSGAGKSTLLYALSGMDSITSGEVVYQNTTINACREKELSKLRAEEFGFVFQQSHLVSNLTLFENITVTGYLNRKKSTQEIQMRAKNLLGQMNAAEAKDRLPSQVSGGEAQRAAVARAVINEPGMLFADEPTGALNRQNTKEVLDLLTELNAGGQSILMVTHDIRAAIRANRLLYLEDGKIIGEMELSPYQENDAKNRETQVNAWLTSLEW